MMYKGIGFDIHHHIRAKTADVYVHDVTPRRAGLTLHRTERGYLVSVDYPDRLDLPKPPMGPLFLAD